MALQVWLPLNGNLNNQGLADITVTNNGATIDNNGKIGKCYRFENYSKYITLNKKCCDFFNDGDSFSYCCWIKISAYATSSSGSGSGGCVLYYTQTTTVNGVTVNGGGFGILINTTGFATAFANPSGGSFGVGIGTIPLNTWTHICMTYDKNSKKLSTYMNGIFKNSNIATSNWSTNAKTFIFGTGSQGGWNVNSDNYQNDIRIYDHCLSPKEVHEIAKGLVLHYPLDDVLNPNLYHITRGTVKTSNGIRWEAISESEWSVKGTKTASYGGPGGLSITENGTYFLKAWRTGPKSTNADAYARITYNDGTYSPYYNIANQSKFLTKDDSIECIWVWPQDDHNTVGAEVDYTIKILICKSNIEQDYIPYSDLNIIYDSSGYENNGTVTGILNLSNDSPRYTASTTFDGNTSGIVIENLNIGNIINTAMTYSFWIKPNGESGARSVYFGSYSSASFSIEKTAGNKLRLWWNGSLDLYSTLTIVDGQWQHIVITKNGSTEIKVYLNGILVQTLTNTYNNITFPTTFRIGRDVRSGDGTPYKGLMSDFRIYATVLSEDDVKELYNTSAFVTDNGVFAEYELYEDNLSDVKKTGLLETANFYENGAESGYALDTDKTRVASNYIISEDFIEI